MDVFHVLVKDSVDPISLLDQDFVFSQLPVLTGQKFREEAQLRGVDLLEEDLERLRRSEILVPLFVARRSLRGVRHSITNAPDPERAVIPQWIFADDFVGLRADRDAGLLDPGTADATKPLRAIRKVANRRVQYAERLYSHWQVVDLRSAAPTLPGLRRRSSQRSSWERALIASEARRVKDRERRTVLLAALESRYYPDVVRALRVPLLRQSAWDTFAREFDARTLLGLLGWQRAELKDEAERLLRNARAVDAIADWSELVRLIAPGRWKDLRGAALLAHDHRIAAEMILLFIEELRLKKRGTKPQPDLALDGRLQTDRGELDEVLTKFGLSPYASVLLVVEGQTEQALLPLVMGELGIPKHEAHIRLINAKTETRDHLLLATYAALPKLGEIKGGVAEFIRPPTRYFIVVDADRTYRAPFKREQERQKWVQVLFEALPSEMQTGLARTEVDSLVLVETWKQDFDFERAHFTDNEIAVAAFATGRPSPGDTVSHLEARLARDRRDILGGHARKLEDAWKGWLRSPSKPDLALALWPTLRRRIRSKRSRAGLDEIPCARILLQADELARSTPRRNVVFRV